MDRFLGKSLTPPSVVKAAHTRPAVDFPKGKMRNNKNFKVFDPNLLQKYQWLRQEENGLLFCVACKVDPRANQKNSFVVGFAGTRDGFRNEAFKRHDDLHQKSSIWDDYLRKQQPKALKMGPMDAALGFAEDKLDERLTNKLIAAHFIASEKLANEKFPPLLTSYEKAGLHIGTTHRNVQGYMIFLSIISKYHLDESISKFKVAPLEDGGEPHRKFKLFCVLSDGSTDKGGLAQEAISIRFVHNGEPLTCSIGFEELEYQHATGTRDAIFRQLAKLGMGKEDVKKSLIGATLDGASVNMGDRSGLKALFLKSNGDPKTKKDLDYFGWKWLLFHHCDCHNLELGLGDMKKEYEFMQEADSVQKKVFDSYHWSPKMTSEAKNIAKMQEEEFGKFGALKAMRWSASSERAVIKFDKNFPITTQHLEAVAGDKTNDRAVECEGLLYQITDSSFVKVFVFLIDLHGVTRPMSVDLQRLQILLIEVLPLLEDTIAKVEGLKDGNGKAMTKFADEFLQHRTYQGVPLDQVHTETRGRKRARAALEQELDPDFEGRTRQKKKRFIQPKLKLNEKNKGKKKNEDDGNDESKEEDAPSAKARLFRAQNCVIDHLVLSLKQRFKPLITPPFSYFNIFDFNLWPQKDSEEFKTYGDANLENLLEHYQDFLTEEEIAGAREEWLPFKMHIMRMRAANPKLSLYEVFTRLLRQRDTDPNFRYKNICIIVEIMVCMSPSTAHVERMFSILNYIKTELRTGLDAETVNKLLHVCTLAPNVADFEPEVILKYWKKLSKTALKKKEKLVIGTLAVPNIYKLKNKYKKQRKNGKKGVKKEATK